MRIGVFGGSFNPVHYGHLLLAESCREQCRLDVVRFIPAADPPHKQGRNLIDGHHRLEMLNLAISGHKPFEASAVEIERGGVSYTVDTLRGMRESHPDDEFFLLLGADMLSDLPSWRLPEVICELAIPVFVGRPGHPLPNPDVLRPLMSAERFELVLRHTVTMPRIELSGTDIRQRVASGQSIRFRTPRAVEAYVDMHGLYRG
jgi:nicotinate-nucleotide adenylyltransferase